MSQSSSISSLKENERESVCGNDESEADLAGRTEEQRPKALLDDAEDTDTSDEEVP